jgi:NAD(P)-dependent dehydrogenase (short-subunit alcohol dehydrogenase family)
MGSKTCAANGLVASVAATSIGWSFRLDGQVALITGGTSGIGKSIALAFDESGTRVVPVGRDASRGTTNRSLVSEWAAYGIRVNAIAPGVFLTPTDEGLLAIPERLQRISERRPMAKLGELEEIQGTAVYARRRRIPRARHLRSRNDAVER